jgi:hypothetical protein
LSDHDKGGGASRTTDPASGTSAATDVSLREVEGIVTYWLERYVTVQIKALDRHVTSEFRALRKLLKSQREDDGKAVKTALDASKELAAKHNDLIRQQEKKDATYATKDEVNRLAGWQSKLGGGLLVLGFIGIANLVKIWTG